MSPLNVSQSLVVVIIAGLFNYIPFQYRIEIDPIKNRSFTKSSSPPVKVSYTSELLQLISSLPLCFGRDDFNVSQCKLVLDHYNSWKASILSFCVLHWLNNLLKYSNWFSSKCNQHVKNSFRTRRLIYKVVIWRLKDFKNRIAGGHQRQEENVCCHPVVFVVWRLGLVCFARDDWICSISSATRILRFTLFTYRNTCNFWQWQFLFPPMEYHSCLDTIMNYVLHSCFRVHSVL